MVFNSRGGCCSGSLLSYAASNAGSLLALLAYPIVLEPYFTLRTQSRIWTMVYGLLVLLIGSCAVMLFRSVRGKSNGQPFNLGRGDEALATASGADESEKLTPGRRLRWLLLAFAPSSLMLGVTNYITTDIASVPLLWIIPLALYLLTMVFAFGRRQLFSSRIADLVVPAGTVVLLLIYLIGTSANGSQLLMLLHLAYFSF